ncbi:MAG TPA: hypothetical protein VFJ30_11105 [Phycisphaerae bacterium]|nr:hypothetical protein [Phycisphaerae bacterium]
MIEYECPHCGEAMESPDGMSGLQEECPACGLSFPVPPSTAASGLTIAWCYAGGILAFWVYWLVLWGTVTSVVGRTLWPEEAQRLVQLGMIQTRSEYSWGDHYVWFLIAIVVVTAVCSGLTGAIAKKRGALIAAISSIPAALLLAGAAYLHYTGQTMVGSPIAWGIVLPLASIAIVATSVVGGATGENVQRSEFGDRTVLGIAGPHFLWLWLPLTPYAIGISGTLARFFAVTWGIADANRLFGTLACLLVLLPVLAFGYPAYLMYQILSGTALGREKLVLKVPAFVGVYICGLTAGFIVDYLCMKLLAWLL